MEEELANRVRQPRQKIVPRPKCWDEVSFKPIPLQEGEEVGTANVEEGPTAPPPIADPLKLRDVDLRETQEIYATGNEGTVCCCGVDGVSSAYVSVCVSLVLLKQAAYRSE